MSLKLPPGSQVAGEFDAAIVALPHALHGSIGTVLLKSGKHVFMEKPLAITAHQCRAMTTAARMAGITLSVGLLRRYLGVARWTKALLKSRILGELTCFEAHEGFVFNSEFATRCISTTSLTELS
jgi:predicted dehydrogenase